MSDSNYPNPLDNFRSYSYHFILSVSNSTQAFRELTELDNGKPKALTAVDGIQLGDRLKLSDDNSEAYLLVDTRRFSQFMITGIEMEHMFGTGDLVNPSVPLSMSMVTLVDTTGLTFFNFLSDVLRNKLRTSRLSAFFLMSIVFVGHKDDGTTEVVTTCNIPFLLMAMEFEFTSSGTVFQIQFMETEGAVQRGQQMDHINSLCDVKAVSTEHSDKLTIGQLIASLERALNIQSLAFYSKYKNGATPNDERAGKLMQYMITIPPEWRDFPAILAGTSEHKELMHLAKPKPESDKEETKADVTIDMKKELFSSKRYYTMSFSNTTTVTDAIMKILNTSLDFYKLASDESINAGKGKSFKTITNITSDKNTFLVHYDVYPYSIPKPKDPNHLFVPTKEGEEPKVLPNIISYDYIFTGKNSHILDLKIRYMPESAIALDMQPDLGTGRFDRNASAQNTEDEAKKVATGTNKPEATDYSQLLLSNDPVIPAIKTLLQQSNGQGAEAPDLSLQEQQSIYKAKQEASRNLAYMHFMSSFDLDLQIRGNPNLMAKYAAREERGGIAPHGTLVAAKVESQDQAESAFATEMAPKLSSARAAYEKEYYLPRIESVKQKDSKDALLGQADIAVSPLMVKLNIMAPNVDWTGTYINQDELFTNKFFYDGANLCLYIKHTLVGGEFTQHMKLQPFDLGGAFSKSRDGNTEDQIKRDK